MIVLRRCWDWLHLMATDEESARYSRVDDELKRLGL